MSEPIPVPFPYFGGKSTVASEVWRRFGEVQNFVEPFCGSCAVLLGRPDFNPDDPPLETVNDKDAFISNFFRAMKAEPEALADICDNPVNECDLEAWHKWLVTASRKADLERRCKDDPLYYDVTIAGRWCWGLCQWIGCGWCAGVWYGPEDERNAGRGINIRDPEHSGKLPHLGGGNGVHRQRPHLGDSGKGVHPCSNWFAALAERLRRVRVCCGDWTRVMGPTPTFKHGLTAIFLDPPYSAEAGRDGSIYKEEDLSVAHAVREWCLENGANPLLRLALCGYDGEHDMPGWDCWAWKARGGYATQNDDLESTGRLNSHRERIWFSPACIKPANHRHLFSDLEALQC